ncbi:triacylglycerol lipase-like protein isoform X1 [Wolffia australiana]
MPKVNLIWFGRLGNHPTLRAPLSVLRRRASNSWSAVQDVYFSTKDIFERHRVVFTISTSVASLATAWAGYSLRHYHQRSIETRLESIEEAMRNSSDVNHEGMRKIVASGGVSLATCLASAWTSLIVGYALGWRGGSWYTRRKLLRAPSKLVGQSNPARWQALTKSLGSLRKREIYRPLIDKLRNV